MKKGFHSINLIVIRDYIITTKKRAVTENMMPSGKKYKLGKNMYKRGNLTFLSFYVII